MTDESNSSEASLNPLGDTKGPDLRVLHQQLYQRMLAPGDVDVFVSGVSELLFRLVRSCAVFYWDGSSGNGLKLRVERARRDELPADEEALKASFRVQAEEVVRTRTSVVAQLPTTPLSVGITTPVISPSRHVGALSVLIVSDSTRVEAILAIVQLVGGYIAFRESFAAQVEGAWVTTGGAALLDLMVRIVNADGVEPASYELVNELQSFLKCQQVVLARADVRRGRADLRLHAVSGVSDFDKRGPVARAWVAALGEAVEEGRVVTWPTETGGMQGRWPAHANALGEAGAACIMTVPLICSGVTVGALGVAWEVTPATPREKQFLAAACEPLAAGLAISAKASPGFWMRASRLLVGHDQSRWPRLRYAALVTLGLLLFLPIWRHRVACDCVLEPVVRRTVSVPFDGILSKSLVRVGDAVSAGEALAHLDGRELRWALAGLMAEHYRADKMGDVSLAGTQVAASQIAGYEKEKLDHQIQLLRNREQNLTVRSPLAGVVIQGDLERAEGAALHKGQKLFDIAPLDDMVAELRVPSYAISHVSLGMEVRIRLDAYPRRTWTGRLERIHPRSEAMDRQNVFISETTVPNGDDLLRPGMHGRAKVMGRRRPLAWILFHRLVEALLSKLEGY